MESERVRLNVCEVWMCGLARHLYHSRCSDMRKIDDKFMGVKCCFRHITSISTTSLPGWIKMVFLTYTSLREKKKKKIKGICWAPVHTIYKWTYSMVPTDVENMNASAKRARRVLIDFTLAMPIQYLKSVYPGISQMHGDHLIAPIFGLPYRAWIS